MTRLRLSVHAGKSSLRSSAHLRVRSYSSGQTSNELDSRGLRSDRYLQHEEGGSDEFTNHGDEVVLDCETIRTCSGVFEIVSEPPSCSFPGVNMFMFVYRDLREWLSCDVKRFHRNVRRVRGFEEKSPGSLERVGLD